MRRGLKLPPHRRGRAASLAITNCPDEEGTETKYPCCSHCLRPLRSRIAPMRRGLKQISALGASAIFISITNCPDEEGTETTRSDAPIRSIPHDHELPR